MKDDQVRACFAFDENDLLANRNGKLSEKQSKRIREADQIAERFVLGLFLTFLTGGIVVGVLAIYARNSIGLWVGTVILLLLAAWLFRGTHTELDDTVQKIQGEINFVKVKKKTGSVIVPSLKRTKVSDYEMQVGGETFGGVDLALIEYMQGDTYVVYFTETTRQILSVEPISKDIDTKKG